MASVVSEAKRFLRKMTGGADTVMCTDLVGVSRSARLTLWACDGTFYREGAPVPHLPNGHSTYSIWVPTKDFFINIDQGRVRGWSMKAIHSSVVSSDGEYLSYTARGR